MSASEKVEFQAGGLPEPVAFPQYRAKHGNVHGALPKEGEIDFSKAPIGKIIEHECPAPIKAPYICGRLAAPLDHLNASNPARASIATIRFPAGGGSTPRSKVKGTILTNPGGPGGSGIAFLGLSFLSHPKSNKTAGYYIDEIVGGSFDILSWDPRGVGRTTPRADCWNSTVNFYIDDLVESASGLPGSTSGAISEHLAGDQLTLGLCLENERLGEELRHLGTPAVVRDMRLLYKASGDEKLNYWGFSYGTVLGSYFADMFPEDVHRLIADGVVDVPHYRLGLWDDNLIDTEAALSGFYHECASAGPKACALAAHVQDEDGVASAQQIGEAISGLLKRLYKRPLLVVKADTPSLVTWSQVKSSIFECLYDPTLWSGLAEDLTGLLKGNGTDFLNKYGPQPLQRPKSPYSEQSNTAIACGDSITPVVKNWNETGVKDLIEHLREDSPLGAEYWAGLPSTCAIWSIKAAEQWYGGFNATTAHPLLFIGNDYDPVTPSASARLMASKFPGAVALTRAGYGHCSISEPSQCIYDHIQAYFVNGTLPEKGARCQVDQPIFGKVGEAAVSGEQTYESEMKARRVEAAAGLAEALRTVRSNGGRRRPL